MRVGVDRKFDTLTPGEVDVGRIQIQADREGVDFKKGVVVARGPADFFQVDVVGFALSDVPARRMADDIHAFVLTGLNQTLCQLLFGFFKSRVD